MPSATPTPDAFVKYWSRAEASERADAQPFLLGLTDLLDVPRPEPTHANGYSFEFPVRIPTLPSNRPPGRIDLYKRECFVLEAKQFATRRPAQAELIQVAGSTHPNKLPKKAWGGGGSLGRGDDACPWAGRALHPRTARRRTHAADVGHSFELYADFTQAGKSYLQFPDPRTFRFKLEALREEAIRDRLRQVWTEPLSLDPAKVSAKVTREIAGYLAVLATSLEKAGHAPRLVAEFLTRCLFCMFAEDVGLLPKDGFRDLLASLRGSPAGFVPKLRTLFAEMQSGTEFSVVLNQKLLRFNGGLFEDASVLPVDGTQLGILVQAAKAQWKDVEPAIFGTLLERALDPRERHQLGAHYTPRAYVERLVLPTVVEPLRAEWEAVKAVALLHAQRDDLAKARAEITRFHNGLCEVKILDPACGSDNFLYVALEHLKRLEGEVLDAAAGFGANLLLDLSTHSVDPHQFLGIEVNPRAAAVAELVLWIGYLQWHFRTRGDTRLDEPVLKKFCNIECRDAVLAWKGNPRPASNDDGSPRTRWDGRSMKVSMITGEAVPDETAVVQILEYPEATSPVWPDADFIVGNPPFLGTRRMRLALGDGYVDALIQAYPEVAENADFVMYWWHKAATLVGAGKVRRFGLITTNSLRQSFNRRVVQANLAAVSLVFAVADHPWVDAAGGAAVRIAMTVGKKGVHPGELLTARREEPAEDGSAAVEFSAQTGRLAADLSVGADLTSTVALESNAGVAFWGVKFYGDGFIVTGAEAAALAADQKGADLARAFVSGKDLTGTPRGLFALDCDGLSVVELARAYPATYQHLLVRVKPVRDHNPRALKRQRWWIFGENQPGMRRSLEGIHRAVFTTETAKHRVFHFLPATTLAEGTVAVISLDDAFYLGVLSSRIHVVFALAAGGTLEDRPRYNKTLCFDPFPFPACDEAAKARIRTLGEELDAHRKRVQARHPGLSLTTMYNVLEALRARRALMPKEQTVHDHGLVSVLRQLHDELDTAVATAYGWPTDLGDAEILARLVALNAARSAEEAAGHVRWLRPDYQAPDRGGIQTGLSLKSTPAT